MILYRAMFNVESASAGLTNVWVREQARLGGPIREVETRSIGYAIDWDGADMLLKGYDPPLHRVMRWMYHPSPVTNLPFWWADLKVAA